jgi:hypothetical protein
VNPEDEVDCVYADEGNIKEGPEILCVDIPANSDEYIYDGRKGEDKAAISGDSPSVG